MHRVLLTPALYAVDSFSPTPPPKTVRSVAKNELTVSFELRSNLQKAFRSVADLETFDSPGLDSRISVKVESNHLKSHAKLEGVSSTLTNLRVVIKEEEITWSHIAHSDGTHTSKLHLQ